MTFLTKLINNPSVQRLVRAIAPKPQTIKQETIDLYNASIALRSYDFFTSSVVNKPSATDIEGFYSFADDLEKKDDLRQYVQDSIETQTLSMFRKLESYADSLEKVMDRRSRSSSLPPKTLAQLVGFELECKLSKLPSGRNCRYFYNENYELI